MILERLQSKGKGSERFDPTALERTPLRLLLKVEDPDGSIARVQQAFVESDGLVPTPTDQLHITLLHYSDRDLLWCEACVAAGGCARISRDEFMRELDAIATIEQPLKEELVGRNLKVFDTPARDYLVMLVETMNEEKEEIRPLQMERQERLGDLFTRLGVRSIAHFMLGCNLKYYVDWKAHITLGSLSKNSTLMPNVDIPNPEAWIRLKINPPEQMPASDRVVTLENPKVLYKLESPTARLDISHADS